MPRYSGSPSIKDFPTGPIEIKCKKCGRHGRYPMAALIENYGSEIILPDLLGLIAGDCGIRGGLAYQGCEAIYPAPSRVQTRKPTLEFG